MLLLKDWTFKKSFPRLELVLIIEVYSYELSGWASDGLVVGNSE